MTPSEPPDEDDCTVFGPLTGAPQPAKAQGPAHHPDAPPPEAAAPSLPPLPQPRSAATGAPEPQIAIGTVINNNYRITQVIKSGGMGAVYRGVEIGTGDPVAIKAILPELAQDEKVGQLFRREARTLRQLTDEAIVRYYNYLHDRDLDRYFLVMEFIEGITLSDHLERHGALPLEAVQVLLHRLSHGLGRAHGQEVVHRDLSPDNVMLPDGQVSRARLIDFGIAKSNVLSDNTMMGQFAGKFKYVAPEQLGHYDGAIGAPTDIYGLALLIAAAARGRPLEMGRSIVEAVQTRQTIPDLSEIPEPLRPLLSHMLEPDPALRPVSMEAVRAMLEEPQRIPRRYLAGRPMPAPMIAALPGVRGTAGLGSLPPVAMSLPTPGLQLPGGGLGAGYDAAQTAPPQPRPAPAAAAPAPARRSGGSGARVLGGLAVLFLAVLGGAGWIAWQQGILGGAPAPAPPAPPSAQAGIPAPLTDTRDGFLAAFDTGACSYLTRIDAGPNAGQIAGFSATGEAFAGLPAAYEEKFGARPSVLPYQIAAPQCAVLEFARALEGRGQPALGLLLQPDTVASGGAVAGHVSAAEGQTIWAALISPLGGVYNLTERLTDPSGGRRELGFGLTLAEGAEAAPQLVLSVASDRPLIAAATAQDGVQASDLLPRLLAEIAAQDGAASVALAHVLLVPQPPADPAPEPAPPAPGDN